MSLTTTSRAAALAALLVDQHTTRGTTTGHHVDEDGVRYTLAIEDDPDHNPPWEEYDSHGRAAWRGARQGRPADMDGAACIIYRDRGEVLWWQPPADAIHDPTVRRAVQDHVTGYARGDWGYVGYTVTVFRPCTHCGGGAEQSASLWGIESNSGDDYAADVVTDLLIQCGVPSAVAEAGA